VLLPLEQFAGIGAATIRKLTRLEIRSAMDALLHLPTRYEDRSEVTPLRDVQPASTVLIEGRITHVRDGGRHGQSSVGLAPLHEEGTTVFDHGRVSLVFFHANAAQMSRLLPGFAVRAWGDVRAGRTGLELVHPDYAVRAQAVDLPPLPDTLTPIYPLTEGLTQARLRMLIEQALARLERLGPLPTDAFFAARGMATPSLAGALRALHAPAVGATTEQLLDPRHPARQRLAMEELLVRQALLAQARARTRTTLAPPCPGGQALVDALLAELPFELTTAQRRVIGEIDLDLAQEVPMLRLLQGDVGSGKTAVAALACARTVGAGQQVAVMVPTEVLATQHFATFERWFAPLGISCALLLGRRGRKFRPGLADGSTSIAIGTQALIQDGVSFQQLGLVIIDEQHRFGVRQRLQLNAKARLDGRVPHQLVLTATPIPRTLAQTAYADLDVSVIDERPRGRKPILTISVPTARRDEVIDRLAANLRAGAQAYWVCPLIENSEHISAAAAEERVAMLRAQLPDLSIGLMHGRMGDADKAAAMDAFKRGETRLLVATTVIEVGVDVPNATLMIIENSERLGLSQLHQLRGRVGRGSAQSHCVLLYEAPLGAHGRARLAALRDSNDGFRLAEQDLALRGPGEILGTRQTGDINMRVADLVRDGDLLARVQPWTQDLLQDPAALAELEERWMPAAEQLASV
jgi:ATP-dependent DNA helicase RecG